MRISDWSSDVCSSDLAQVSRDFVTPEDVELMTREGEGRRVVILINHGRETRSVTLPRPMADVLGKGNVSTLTLAPEGVAVLSERRSEEHTSELQSLMRISYAVFCLKKKKTITTQ